jgi:hypothetical protein
MIKHFCDLCERESYKGDLTSVSPGYWGDFSLCKMCYARWREVAGRFFKKLKERE